jgi:hypothetical protein
MADVRLLPVGSTGSSSFYAQVIWKDFQGAFYIRLNEDEGVQLYGCHNISLLFPAEAKCKLMGALRTASGLEELIQILAEQVALRINGLPKKELVDSDGLFRDLARIGLENVQSLAQDQSSITFKYSVSGSPFKVECKLPLSSRTCTFEPELPFADQLPIDWTSLESAYLSLRDGIGGLAPYFETLDLIDGSFLVLRAEKIGPRRTIVTGFKESVDVELNPFRPLDKPACSRTAVDKWCSDLGFVENIKRAFGIPFASELNCLNCGICSAILLDDALAVVDVRCDASDCQQVYHQRCLLEWVQTDPRAIKSFGTYHFECIYCSAKMIINE